MFDRGNQQLSAGFSHNSQKAETEFSAEQIRQLSELINQAVSNWMSTAETAEPKGDQGELEPSEAEEGMSFKLNDIRYFDSGLTTDLTTGKRDIHQVERNMFFTDVFLFIEKLKDVAVSHTSD